MWLETAPTVWRLAISGQRSVVSGKPANPLNPPYQGDRREFGDLASGDSIIAFFN